MILGWIGVHCILVFITVLCIVIIFIFIIGDLCSVVDSAFSYGVSLLDTRDMRSFYIVLVCCFD